MQLHFGNISQWGEKVYDFLNERKPSVFLFAEHKLMNSALGGAKDRLYSMGLKPFLASAKIKHTGPSGGTGLVAQRHLAVTPLATRPDLCAASLAQGAAWASALLRLKGAWVLLVSVYIPPGGLIPSNLNLLFNLRNMLKTLSIPFILLGDWNLDGEELSSIPWLDELDAFILPLATLC